MESEARDQSKLKRKLDPKELKVLVGWADNNLELPYRNLSRTGRDAWLTGHGPKSSSIMR